MAAEITEQRTQDKFPNLEREVARTMWPTPQSRDFKGPSGRSMKGTELDLPMAAKSEGQAGALNPEWVEWLMGFPVGWTNLESE
jgi:hypothetical protein